MDRVLGRPRGVRIGEAADRDGQYFHYLAQWVYALERLGRIKPEYRSKAVDLVKQIHPAFVIPGRGIWWKMEEDLSGPYPGYGLGGLDPFQAYVTWRLLDPDALKDEIAELKAIVDRIWRGMVITQDLGLGMMLWMTHLAPDEDWARAHHDQSLAMLNRMWIDPPGYFCRQPELPQVKFAFTNYGVSVGLQSVGAWSDRVDRLTAVRATAPHRSRLPAELRATTIAASRGGSERAVTTATSTGIRTNGCAATDTHTANRRRKGGRASSASSTTAGMIPPRI